MMHCMISLSCMAFTGSDEGHHREISCLVVMRAITGKYLDSYVEPSPLPSVNSTKASHACNVTNTRGNNSMNPKPKAAAAS